MTKCAKSPEENKGDLVQIGAEMGSRRDNLQENTQPKKVNNEQMKRETNKNLAGLSDTFSHVEIIGRHFKEMLTCWGELLTSAL